MITLSSLLFLFHQTPPSCLPDPTSLTDVVSAAGNPIVPSLIDSLVVEGCDSVLRNDIKPCREKPSQRKKNIKAQCSLILEKLHDIQGDKNKSRFLYSNNSSLSLRISSFLKISRMFKKIGISNDVFLE